ncbi:MAG: dynein regulation protein LC7 [Candidatus Aegiribacteria sp.]|nr:dynein regulation protein LC7 [Candidatus Aegiribacteria sp.]
MEKLHKILEELVEVPGIDVAVCVGRDGFVIDAASTGSSDTEAIGAMVSTGMGSAESVGRELGLKEMDQAMMEFKGGIVMMTALGKDALLAIVAAKDANLGGVRLQVRRSAPKILEAM